MNPEFILLNIAVIAAAALQSATGIGFGVIAGPILLIVLNDGSAIHVSIMLNLLIALLVAPSLRRQASIPVLKGLAIGIAAGSPVGLLVFLSIGTNLLKVFAGITVLITLYLTVRRHANGTASNDTSPTHMESAGIGVVAGIMGACLAMPGPIPAAWMSARGFNKDQIRATILSMFVLAYAIALGLQAALADIESATIRFAAFLAPATILGLVIGNLISQRISAPVFRRILLTILALTAAVLFSSLIGVGPLQSLDLFGYQARNSV